MSPNGNIALVGNLRDYVDINGDGDFIDGGAENISPSGPGVFVAVHNSSGTWQWAKRLDGTYSDTVATNSANNVIVGITGGFGALDLNGDGDSTNGGAESGTGDGNYDEVVIVFDSAGTWQWAKSLMGAYANVKAVATDSLNNIAIAGIVNGTADMNGDGDKTDGGAESATGYGNNDGFVSVYDSAGNKR